MENIVGLIVYGPIFFFQAGFALFSAGWIALNPALGIAGLVLGTAIGIPKRIRPLLLFVVPFLLSQFLLIVAGTFPGAVPVDLTLPAVILFLMVQVGFAGYAIYRATGARTSAAGLTVFTLSCALTALVSAGMFSNEYFFGPQTPSLEGAAAPALFCQPVFATG